LDKFTAIELKVTDRFSISRAGDSVVAFLTEEFMGTNNIFRAAVALAWIAITLPALAAETPAKPRAQTAAKSDIERGRYLVAIAACHDCHTPGFIVNGSKTPQKDWLTGGVLGWRGAWGTSYPANLRLYFQEITEDQWVQVAREMQRRPPMPYYALNQMAEPDVRALYKYVRSLGPAGRPAPAHVPPDKVPPQPYVQFPDKLN
jgi:mono/diheme cytochrome c family protein